MVLVKWHSELEHSKRGRREYGDSSWAGHESGYHSYPHPSRGEFGDCQILVWQLVIFSGVGDAVRIANAVRT